MYVLRASSGILSTAESDSAEHKEKTNGIRFRIKKRKKTGQRPDVHVRNANEMRMRQIGKRKERKKKGGWKDHESRVNYSNRQAKRHVTEKRILFPDVPRAADCTEVSERLERYAGEEGCEGEVCGDMGAAI